MITATIIYAEDILLIRREMNFMVDSAFDSKIHKFIHLLSFDRYHTTPALVSH